MYSINNIRINDDITTTNVSFTLSNGVELCIDIAHYQLSSDEEMNQNILNRISSEELKLNPPVIIIEEIINPEENSQNP